MEWIIIGIIAVLICWGFISNYIEELKNKVYLDVKNEYQTDKLINEIKNILNKKKYFDDHNGNYSNENYQISDLTIGHCPKCNTGYLGIGKTFTGLDYVYHKYPTYHKYLRCSNCSYTESYYNLKSRRMKTKNINSEQFINDFKRAYKLN